MGNISLKIPVVSKMTLGTVQLGMNYGIANNNGQPSTEKSFRMLSAALSNGVTSLDTAAAYGTAETVLGDFFRSHPATEKPFLTSKIIIDLPGEATATEVEKKMFSSVEASLKRLNVEHLDCLLLHRAGEMTSYGTSVSETMKKLIAAGYIRSAGVSVYLPSELDTMLNDDIYTATQVPMSLFDQKLIAHGYIEKLKNRGITVFVRSVFLQGLFFLNPDTVTDPILVEYAVPYLRKLRSYCEQTNMSIAEFAISFIRDVPGVSSLVLGADNEDQVVQNVGYLNSKALPAVIRQEVYRDFSSVNLPKIMEVLSRPKG